MVNITVKIIWLCPEIMIEYTNLSDSTGYTIYYHYIIDYTNFKIQRKELYFACVLIKVAIRANSISH